MNTATLVLSGDMAGESDGGVWSITSQSNDTLTISPDPSSGVWTLGTHTLIINAVGANGAPLKTLTLSYNIEAPIPTAVAVPADSSTIIGSDLIVIIFSATMEPSTLVMSGDMAAESKAGVWSMTNKTNDTLLIRPITVWTGAADTLVIDIDSAEGASLPTLTLNYFVDVSVPIAIESPADGSAINNMTPIVIDFTIEMNPATLQPLGGSMGIVSDGGVWSSNSDPNDTLTISPVGAWSGGLQDLIIDVDAINGVPLPTLQLDYTVDDAMPTASVTPVTGSSITSGQEIEIVFSKSMDTASLTPSGSLWDNADQNVTWSMTTYNNDTLTISPATSWPVPTVDLSLDILDLVGNSLTLPLQEYIVDVMVPVITLTGNLTVNVERGTAYVDAGATATDNIDGDITGSIVVGGDAVDVNTVGAYIITYDVRDAAGLPATQVTRTVNVTPDVTIPVISLSGNAVVNIERGSVYVDDGATATDSFDGDLTSSIVTVNPVDTSTVGTYTVTYNVVDSSGNAAVEVARTVNVTPDVTIPVITLVGASSISLEAGTSYTEPGATASDNVDDDATITSAIVIDASAVDINTVGNYTVTYNVTDTSGNAALQVTRTVNVTDDITIPTITLLGNAVVNIERGTTYTDAGATASDTLDGDLTGSIVTDNPVDVNTVGAYTVTYNVTDSSGNAAVQARTVNVTADVTLPTITLLGNAVVNIERGTVYVDAGATAADSFDGDLTGSIVTVNPVDVNTLGAYTVTYNVVDSSGNAAVQASRTVNVTADVTLPTITLLGNAVVNIERGTAYVDAGATAADSFDGDITGSIVTVNPVDVNTVGAYTVTYNVVDSSGNAAVQVTRTVNVTADATIPVITLLGNAVVNIERGTAYVDAGATASDNFDGDITGSIIVGGDTVDESTVGTYIITYDVTDSSSNAAVQVSRTVNVTPDVTIPVITLVGNAIVSVEQGTVYVDAGATALDNFDGDITGSIVVGGDTVDENTVGTYIITYDVLDSSANAATQVTRTVNVTTDVTVPVITLVGNAVENIERGTAYVDAGATATDNIDGDITGSIIVGGDTVDESTVGTYVITYNVMDSSGNTAVQVSRTVNVTADVTIPTITLLGNAVVNIERGTAYVDAGATASDSFDGDITGSIVTVNPVDVNTVGAYTVTYNVVDSSGNAAVQVTRTVNVTADVTIPVITLIGNAVVNIERGTAYADAGATATDSFDGDITGSIVTVNPVDVNTVGAYTVTYNVVDSSGNAATQVSRTVNVTPDATIPVITLVGNAIVSVEQGTAYVDAGATALDNIDGDISGSIVVGGDTVDENTVGAYIITYDVVDSTGNAAIQVTRTVNVTTDVTIPVITLLGNAVVNIERGTVYVDAGATALDNIDGDISGSIVMGGDTVDESTVGTYIITYNVMDSSGNAAVQVSRTVNVTADVTIPTITLLGNAVVNIERGTAYVDAGATASDSFDGDITGSIVTVNPVDVNTVGAYTVTYNVMDSSGNSAVEVTRTVNVTADVTIPTITLLGNAVVNIERGTTYVDAGATAADNFDGDITGSIVVGGDTVDENTVGTYFITYDVTDSSGNTAAQVSRTVNVTADVTAPIISLVGANPVSLEVGSSYTEFGATATDNVDDNAVISAAIVINSSAVNVNVVGTYYVVYNVTDSSGNAATQVARTVNVTADVTIPTITLLGNAVVNIERGTAYVDAGATASDNFDGDITGSIVTVNPVDVNTVGSYTVTYNVSDSSGNAAVEVTRTVNITADVTIPVITLLGNTVENIERGTAYVDAGATALDNFDGVITGSILVGGDVVDVNTVGAYVITYDVADSSGNAAVQVSRTVNVTPDVTIPVITLVGNAVVNIERGTAYVDAGATAADNFDGDITGSIVVGGDTVDVNTVGTYIITYDVADSSGNAAVQVTRTVNVTADVTIPVITLLGNAIENIEYGMAYVDAGATAADNFDGDITGSIVVGGDAVDVNTVGTYIITYDVADSSGNSAVQISRTVNIIDLTEPVITLTGNAIVNVERGTAYVDAGATAQDYIDGDITSSIVVGGDAVDVNTVGTYIITYDVADSSGNAAVQVSRSVNVTPDVTIPVITLVGNAIENIERGTAYVDAGATALDNFDGNITGSIVVGGDTVDVNTVGTYIITYDVADSSGNTAVQVSRTVNVTPDVTIPVITLLGNAIENIEYGTVYVDAGATATDNFDGDITISIVVGGDAVDVNTVGTYIITYDVTDSSGNAAVQVSRTVNVVDLTIPVITLSGINPQDVILGGVYVEAGATAFDNVDGDISGSIVIDSSAVDTAAVGNYSVTYNVSDAAGNDAVEVIRTVRVRP